jgi:peptide/nickel transport system substrate-binding protein
LLSGGVDIASEMPGELLGELESSDSVRPVTSPSIRVAYINLRASDRLTSQPLREAFFYATNIDVIVDEILGGQAEKLKAGNPVTQYEFGYDSTIPDWPYDPDMARQKLEEAGYDGHEITLVYQVGGLPSIDTIAQALQAMWAEVGLNVTLVSEEAGVYNTNWRAGEMTGDIFLNTTGGKAMDSDARLVPHVMCANAETGVGRVSWFCDPAIDEVILKSQVTMDETEREQLLKQAWAMNRDTAHTMSLYSPYIIYGVNNRVQWQPTIEDLYSTLRTAQITA